MAFAIFLIVVAGLSAAGVITEGNKETAPLHASTSAKPSPTGPTSR